MNDILDVQTLRSMREAKGWDQRTLARAASIDQSVVSRLERGIQGDLKASVLIGLARAFHTSVDSLLAPALRQAQSPLVTELSLVVGELAQLPEAQQRHAAAILRGYVSGLPSSKPD